MKYSIITYGCQMNKSDSERIAAKLEKESPNDLVVINACSIRQSAIDRVYSKVKQLKGKKIILTGCLLEKDKKQLAGQVYQIWPIIDLEIEPKRQSREKAWLPIMTGCNNFCTYCVVPFTRGREYSRPAKKIIAEAKDLVKKGYQEITLLGQNVNSYPDFPDLLQKIARLGQGRVNFLTSHPKDMSDQLIKVIAQNKQISRQIHLPVQSGNNQILKKMNRGYTVGQYKKLVKKIRRQIPQVQISTDIIVGFPEETQKQFQDTVNLAKEIGFNQIYASAYSKRPGTAAARMKDSVPSDEKKRRKKIILKICAIN